MAKRQRATSDEMEERARFLIDYATEHGPVTIRQLFYQSVVRGLPGIDKTEQGYGKIQAQVLDLRRAGRLPYDCIADATRYMRRPRTFRNAESALQETARFYRKSLWADRPEEVEIWLEKSALAGVLAPVTREYDVALMPTAGYSSETFAHDAVAGMQYSDQRLVIYALYDFDRSGQDASNSLQEKVERFGEMFDVEVEFNALGLDLLQVIEMNLPTRPPKRNTTADQRWPHEIAAELDAIAPDDLRQMVRDAIEGHLPRHELEQLRVIEAAEKRTLFQIAEGLHRQL